MNNAGTVIQLSAHTPWGGGFDFSARVLYWWEVQGIRMASVVRDKIAAKSFLDRSRLYGQMVDTFLDSITDEGNTLRRGDLAVNETWRQRLHPTIIKPLYDAYNARCSPTTEELNAFREQVRAYYDPTSRPEGIYIVPPEIWEMVLLSRMGGMSLSEIRGLSYTEMRKFLIIVELMDGTSAIQPASSGQGDGPFAGLVTGPLLADPRLTPEELQMMMASGHGLMAEGGRSQQS